MSNEIVYFAKFQNGTTVFTKDINATSIAHAEVIAEDLAAANNWSLLFTDLDVIC